MKFKKLILFIVIFLSGYALYPVLNPPEKEEDRPTLTELFRKFLFEEGKTYADAESAEEKLRAADAMYEKMMLLFLANLGLEAPKNKKVDWNIKLHIVEEKPKKEIIEKKVPIKASPVATPEPETLAARLKSGRMNVQSVISLRTLPVLLPTDSKIRKLFGKFSGDFKPTGETRVDMIERASFEISETPKLVQMKITDSYDNMNEGASFTINNLDVFRNVPGDENLVLLDRGEGQYLVFDISTFPEITGRVYDHINFRGDLRLKKTGNL